MSGSLVALGLAIACGGRTSALDSSAYDGSVDVVSGSGGKAGAATSGKAGAGGARGGAGGARGGAGGRAPNIAGRPATSAGSSAIGGTAPTQPATGGVGASGPISMEIDAVCKDHCSAYGFTCGADVAACVRSCELELSDVGVDCRDLGLNALRCVAPDFQVKGVTCPSGTELALARCARSLALFEACKGAPFSTPVPRDGDTDVSTCGGSITGNDISCDAVFSCDDGDYVVSCYFGSGSALMLADCECADPRGSLHFGFVKNDGLLCHFAAQQLCHD